MRRELLRDRRDLRADVRLPNTRARSHVLACRHPAVPHSSRLSCPGQRSLSRLLSESLRDRARACLLVL